MGVCVILGAEEGLLTASSTIFYISSLKQNVYVRVVRQKDGLPVPQQCTESQETSSSQDGRHVF